jgi:hemerythrin-like metal-binding protein
LKEPDTKNLLINPDDPRYCLGVDSMDSTHQEFMALVNQLGSADSENFIQLFSQLLKHTEKHFSDENALMESSGFFATKEHQGEHSRVLGDLHKLGEKVAAGNISMAQAYVRKHIPEWFQLHAATMDSALAGHLKGQRMQSDGDLSVTIIKK